MPQGHHGLHPEGAGQGGEAAQKQLQALSNSNGLEPGLADNLLRETQSAMARQAQLGLPAVLVVQHPLRVLLARFLRRSLPQLKVLSHAEIPDTRTIRVTATIGGKS